MHLFAAVLFTAFNLSLAALANYSVTTRTVPILKYREKVYPVIETVHLNLFYLLLFMPYFVQHCEKYCFNYGLPR